MKLSKAFPNSVFTANYFVKVCAFVLIAHVSLGNNIVVSNLTLTGQNTSAGSNNVQNFSLVKFDLSWDNSWRSSTGPANWDAAWVFVKYRIGANNPTFADVALTNGSNQVTLPSVANLRKGMPVRIVATTYGTGSVPANTLITAINTATNVVTLSANFTASALNRNTLEFVRIWQHATLNTTAGSHTAPTGSKIDVPSDGKGALIYRSTNGAGTFSLTDVRLRWQYGIDSVSDFVPVSVQVFAIEMVYVPGGVDFNVGGGGGNSAFTTTTINTANVAIAPVGTGSLGGQAGGYPTGQTGPTAGWPNGYNAFYCMKYEISQGQYRDFLNTLTRLQQGNRFLSDGAVGRYAGGFNWGGSGWSPGSESYFSSPPNRNGLRLVADPGGASPRTFACDLTPSSTLPSGVNQSDDGEWIAMSQLNWLDGCAYMDWSGLRPMTELEFEKACRGNQFAVTGEYAWGNTTVTAAANITNPGTNQEISNTTNANAVYGNVGAVQGPMRVGAHSVNATTRQKAGATYYGIMEMSGNLWERAVSIGLPEGRVFTGNHGNGVLSNNGHANEATWPGLTSGEVLNSTGSCHRGGAFLEPSAYSGVSDRISGAPANDNRRFPHIGFRGVRTAP
jgi:formylglycine-generating enzyme required for sulfatase activity